MEIFVDKIVSTVSGDLKPFIGRLSGDGNLAVLSQ